MANQNDANELVFHAANESDTERLAAVIANSIDSGLAIALVGTLGAGKTRLVQNIAANWGIEKQTVVSPTFTLCTQHSGNKEFHHVDTYRLADDDQWSELEFDELIDEGRIVFIEWADKFAHLLPGDRLTISISIESETGRQLTIQSGGPRSADVLCQIQHQLGMS